MLNRSPAWEHVSDLGHLKRRINLWEFQNKGIAMKDDTKTVTLVLAIKHYIFASELFSCILHQSRPASNNYLINYWLIIDWLIDFRLIVDQPVNTESINQSIITQLMIWCRKIIPNKIQCSHYNLWDFECTKVTFLSIKNQCPLMFVLIISISHCNSNITAFLQTKCSSHIVCIFVLPFIFRVLWIFYVIWGGQSTRNLL